MHSEACLQWFHSLLAAPAVPDSALPIGMEKEDGSTQLVPVEPSECIHLFHANYKCAGQAEYSWFHVVHCCSGDAHIIKSADLYRERFDYLCACPHPQLLGPCRISHVVDLVSLDCCARGKIVKSLTTVRPYIVLFPDLPRFCFFGLCSRRAVKNEEDLGTNMWKWCEVAIGSTVPNYKYVNIKSEKFLLVKQSTLDFVNSCGVLLNDGTLDDEV